VTAGRIYNVGEAGKLAMEKLPYAARVKTFSNDAQTTDSAPSTSAYMTGVKDHVAARRYGFVNERVGRRVRARWRSFGRGRSRANDWQPLRNAASAGCDHCEHFFRGCGGLAPTTTSTVQVPPR
jgi:hypothetical protein